MKNVLAMMLSTGMGFGMMACSSDQPESNAPSTSATQTTTETQATPPPPPPEEPEDPPPMPPSPPPPREREGRVLNNMNLSWTPATEDLHGSPMNLDGYEIVYGCMVRGYYEYRIDIRNPSVTEYVVENLPPETCYFRVRGYIITGDNEYEYGGLSNEIES